MLDFAFSSPEAFGLETNLSSSVECSMLISASRTMLSVNLCNDPLKLRFRSLRGSCPSSDEELLSSLLEMSVSSWSNVSLLSLSSVAASPFAVKFEELNGVSVELVSASTSGTGSSKSISSFVSLLNEIKKIKVVENGVLTNLH